MDSVLGPNRTFKLSRGEIYVANFIPANGASLGSYLVKNIFWLVGDELVL